MQIEPITRRFYYLGLELLDLDPRLTPEQVKDSYSGLHPEITNATIEGPEVEVLQIQNRPFGGVNPWGPAGPVCSRSAILLPRSSSPACDVPQ